MCKYLSTVYPVYTIMIYKDHHESASLPKLIYMIPEMTMPIYIL